MNVLSHPTITMIMEIILCYMAGSTGDIHIALDTTSRTSTTVVTLPRITFAHSNYKDLQLKDASKTQTVLIHGMFITR
jgi:hypothetical protein